MPFPRLLPFKFDFRQTYVVQNQYVGRLDKIANSTFQYTEAYKPILRFNNISLPIGMRAGIRPTKESIATELAFKNKTKTVTEEQINDLFLIAEPNTYEWSSYSDVSNGYISDVNNGDIILLPSFESTERWLRTYQFINQEDGETYTS